MQRGALRITGPNGAQDLAMGAWPDGTALVRSGQTMVGMARARLVELSADFTVASATLADVTGASFDLNGSTTYCWYFDFVVNQTTANSTQGYGVNYSGSVTRIAYQALFTTGAGAAVTGLGATANNTALVGAAVQNTGTTLSVRVSGSIRTNASGTLTLRAQRSAATTVIKAGAVGLLSEA